MFKQLFFTAIILFSIAHFSKEQLNSQEKEEEIIVISERVGAVIDLEERNLYKLFRGIDRFQSAVVLKLSDGSYVFKITYLDEATNEEKVRIIPQDESGIKRIREFIDNSEPQVSVSKTPISFKLEDRDYLHNDLIVELVFSSDESLLASACLDNIIKIWDLSSGKLKTRLPKHGRRPLCLAFSPDNRYLAVGDERNVSVWDFATGKKKLRRMHNTRCLMFNNAGDLLVCGSYEKIYFYDTNKWRGLKKTYVMKVMDDSDIIITLKFSPDDTKIVGGSHDGSFIIDAVNFETIKKDTDAMCPLVGWEDNSQEIVLDSKGNIRRVGSKEVLQSTPFRCMDTELPYVKTSQQWDMLVFMLLRENLEERGTLINEIHIWDILAQKKLDILEFEHSIGQLAVSASGKYLALGEWGVITVLDLK